MRLRFEDLTEFLARENAMPSVGDGDSLDAKGAVRGLLALRTREISRLRYDEANLQKLHTGDERFHLALADIPSNDVTGCFDGAILVYKEEGGSMSSTALPGQVTSPRKEARREASGSLRKAGRGDAAPVVVDVEQKQQQRLGSKDRLSGRDAAGLPPPPRSPSGYTLMPGVPPPPPCPPPAPIPSHSAASAKPMTPKKRCSIM